MCICACLVSPESVHMHNWKHAHAQLEACTYSTVRGGGLFVGFEVEKRDTHILLFVSFLGEGGRSEGGNPQIFEYLGVNESNHSF